MVRGFPYRPAGGNGAAESAAGRLAAVLLIAACLSVPARHAAGAADGQDWYAVSRKGACAPASPSASDSAKLALVAGLEGLGAVDDGLEVGLGRQSFFLGRDSCEDALKAAPGRTAPVLTKASYPPPPLEVYAGARYSADRSGQVRTERAADEAWAFDTEDGFEAVVDFYRPRLPAKKTESKMDGLYLVDTPKSELRLVRSGGRVWIEMTRKSVIQQAAGERSGGVTVGSRSREEFEEAQDAGPYRGSSSGSSWGRSSSSMSRGASGNNTLRTPRIRNQRIRSR